jgi:hypothetical protein
MAEIAFDIHIEGESSDDSFLDGEAIDMLLDSTRAQIREHILRRVGGYICSEHGQPPKILVSGTYSFDTEQLEYSYNIEACCNLMTMQTASLLSRV